MSPSRLWLHSSLLFFPPGNHPCSPLSLTGHWPFHDQLYFTSEFLPPESHSVNPPSCLWLSHAPVYILHFQPLATPGLLITSSLPVCTRPFFLSTQTERYDPVFYPFSWQPLFNPIPFSPILTNHLISLLLCPHQWELWETKNITKHWNWINRAGYWAQLSKPDFLNPLISLTLQTFPQGFSSLTIST